jgi:hypothetical protein
MRWANCFCYIMPSWASVKWTRSWMFTDVEIGLCVRKQPLGIKFG